MKRVVISAGGTGGHIQPAISIAREFVNRGWEVHYIGNKEGMEEGLVKSAGIPFYPINVQKLYRKLTFKHVRFPFMLLNSYKKCIKYLKDINPDIYLGCGGFVSGPAGLAAVKLNIPIYLQEQNSYPGITTRFLSKHAKIVFTAYEAAESYLKADDVRNVGNPTNISEDNHQQLELTKYNLTKETKKLLVLGGSQGSVVMNNLIESCIDELLEQNIEVIWQTGKRNYLNLKDKFSNKQGTFIFAFTNKMNEMYNSADIVVARAGALTLSELQIKKIPSILIPLPSAAENHQYFNAKELADKGMARIIEQKHLTKSSFIKVIGDVVSRLENIKTSFPEFNEPVQSLITDQINKDMEK